VQQSVSQVSMGFGIAGSMSNGAPQDLDRPGDVPGQPQGNAEIDLRRRAGWIDGGRRPVAGDRRRIVAEQKERLTEDAERRYRPRVDLQRRLQRLPRLLEPAAALEHFAEIPMCRGRSRIELNSPPVGRLCFAETPQQLERGAQRLIHAGECRTQFKGADQGRNCLLGAIQPKTGTSEIGVYVRILGYGLGRTCEQIDGLRRFAAEPAEGRQ
jgi:hypothetical protein